MRPQLNVFILGQLCEYRVALKRVLPSGHTPMATHVFSNYVGDLTSGLPWRYVRNPT